MNSKVLFLLCFILSNTLAAQLSENNLWRAGFRTRHLTDSTRIYKPGSTVNNRLHYRPIDLDIWYPSDSVNGEALLFEDLFRLHETRANAYQNETDYTGFSEELILYMAAGFGLEATEGNQLLKVKTNSYKNTSQAQGNFPVIIYMAGYNGMGWENYRLLENLAENGFIVISISSIGKYPGDMTNDLSDTMEQVYDAKFAIDQLKKESGFVGDFDTIGVLGLSWGGMSGAILIDQAPLFKAFVSLDGTDIYYFGETKEDDTYLNKIYSANLLHPEINEIPYLHIEAGDRLTEFTPSGEYHYYKKSKGPKAYVRFKDSKHEDFGSISWALKTSPEKIRQYERIMSTTVLFFLKQLKHRGDFDIYTKNLLEDENITDLPYQYSTEELHYELVSGQITAAKTNKALAYVNIGVLGKELGTVSNTKGHFELGISSSNSSDTLRISSIGYESIDVRIDSIISLKKSVDIQLKEDVSKLNEIVLRVKTWKYKSLGNNTKSTFIGHLFYYQQLGKEMGIRMNVGKKPLFVESFNFHVSYNRFSAKSFFRLNMYAIENGKPGRNILQENIIIPVKAKQTGMISTDLSQYDIILNEDVITTLEWVDNEGEILPTEALVISVGLMTGGTYERNSKQAKMKKKLKGMGLGFTLDVRY